MPRLPDEIRATLPPVAVAYLAALEAAVATLQAENAALRAEVEALKARLGQNSTNSGRPPSTDPPRARPASRPARGTRRPGGQPGHPGAFRALRPLEQVDRVVTVVPDTCRQCAYPLPAQADADDPLAVRHQGQELPAVRVPVTEYRLAGRPAPSGRGWPPSVRC